MNQYIYQICKSSKFRCHPSIDLSLPSLYVSIAAIPLSIYRCHPSIYLSLPSLYVSLNKNSTDSSSSSSLSSSSSSVHVSVNKNSTDSSSSSSHMKGARRLLCLSKASLFTTHPVSLRGIFVVTKNNIPISWIRSSGSSSRVLPDHSLFSLGLKHFTPPHPLLRMR
jgi:hypothetical protein